MNPSSPAFSFAHAFKRMRPMCLLNRHEPAGRRALFDGLTYISRCEHCDKPIFRVKKGKWKRDRRRNAQR